MDNFCELYMKFLIINYYHYFLLLKGLYKFYLQSCTSILTCLAHKEILKKFTISMKQKTARE